VSCFGWVFWLLFWVFNHFMAAWLIEYWSVLNQPEIIQRPEMLTQAGRAGAFIGGTIGTGVIAFFWMAGAVILGLFALLSRGRKTIVTEQWQ
jgi:hypothetical protein